MAKRSRREKTSVKLTVHVEFVRDHSEQWVRQHLGPAAFMTLTRALAASIADQVSDVERVTVCEPARRNIGAFVERHRRVIARV